MSQKWREIKILAGNVADVVSAKLSLNADMSMLPVFCEQGMFFKHTPVVCKRRQAYTIVYKQLPVVCKQGIQGIDEPREGLGVQSRVVGQASSITSTAAHRASHPLPRTKHLRLHLPRRSPHGSPTRPTLQHCHAAPAASGHTSSAVPAASAVKKTTIAIKKQQ